MNPYAASLKRQAAANEKRAVAGGKKQNHKQERTLASKEFKVCGACDWPGRALADAFLLVQETLLSA